MRNAPFPRLKGDDSMREIVLFIAMSLDGFIADRNGGVGWLAGQSEEEETADTYPGFADTVDTVIMGWNTYHQIVTELSPAEWVYGDFTSYVITHRSLPSTDSIIFTEEDPCALAAALKRRPGKNIWICGGAVLARQLLRAGLVDRYHISVIPTLLGSGIRLFESLPNAIQLKLTSAQAYNGIAELIYTRR